MSLRVGADIARLQVRNRLTTTGVAPSHDGGQGVRGMEERVTLLGGVMRAGSDGNAWCVEVELPRVLETA
jgi:glucose-6-phosphate-specific signal transduction histidine kinase